VRSRVSQLQSKRNDDTYPILFNDHWDTKHLILNDAGLMEFWKWDVLQDELENLTYAMEDGDKRAGFIYQQVLHARNGYNTGAVRTALISYGESDYSDEGVRRVRDLNVYG
jgi:hypothetical protein